MSHRSWAYLLLCVAAAPALGAADQGPARSGQGVDKRATVPSPAPPQPATVFHNAQVLQQLPFADRQDYADAQKGFIATLRDVTMKDAAGNVVFTLGGFDFLARAEAPASVNPSLWRQAQLNMNHGLFEVVKDGVYQIRGFDMANMTIVEGDTGVIVIDPLEAVETSRAGLDLYYQHRLNQDHPTRPIKAIIYTHSHHDHYAGVRGVVSDADLANVQVLAPDGFLEAAVSENVYAGIAMARRASYMYGVELDPGERGLVDTGLGKRKSTGTTSLIAPTDVITWPPDGKRPVRRVIDGVEIEFWLAPGTEAPAEMTFYLPRWRVLDAAEIACPLMHNVLTLRGAQVRDPKVWAESLYQLIALYGDKSDVLITQHNWPRWGSDVLQLLRDQRDLYKFMHDQTLQLMNQGHTPIEIAEMMRLPPSLAQRWYVRDYYGTLSHNVKAIYQRYLGWYDGNPANLNPLPPAEAARKYVELMGGPQAVTARARQDFRNGEYRWVAQLMNHVVFAYPDYAEGRHLQAEALEQLGYQAESAPWRNFYLTGAQELRGGVRSAAGGGAGAAADTIRAMTMPLLFDYWAVILNRSKASGKSIVVNWTITGDPVGQYALNLSNNALTFLAGWHDPSAQASVTLSRASLNAILLKRPPPAPIVVTGDSTKFWDLMGMFDTSFETSWPIVSP